MAVLWWDKLDASRTTTYKYENNSYPRSCYINVAILVKETKIGTKVLITLYTMNIAEAKQKPLLPWRQKVVN